MIFAFYNTYIHKIIQALQHRIQLESEVSTARNENSSKKHYDVMKLVKQQRQHIAESSACLLLATMFTV